MGFLEKSFFINIKRLFKKTIEIKNYLKIKKTFTQLTIQLCKR